MINIASDFWLLLLIGQYPNGPLGGLSMTLIMSLAAIALVIPCAIGLSLALVSPHRWLRSSSAWLAQTIRGVPLLMCVFWVYFGIPLLIGRPVAGPVALVISLVVYHTAYVAEILRAGIAAIPAAQNDAVKTLGLGYWSQMLSIALPQAFITMAPSLILKISSIVKDTSVAYIISTPELSFAASQINAVLVTQPLQVFGLLAAVYFVICGLLTAVANHVQQRSSAFKAR